MGVDLTVDFSVDLSVTFTALRWIRQIWIDRRMDIGDLGLRHLDYCDAFAQRELDLRFTKAKILFISRSITQYVSQSVWISRRGQDQIIF